MSTKKRYQIGPFIVSEEIRNNWMDVFKTIEYRSQTHFVETMVKCLSNREDQEKLLGILQKYK